MKLQNRIRPLLMLMGLSALLFLGARCSRIHHAAAAARVPFEIQEGWQYRWGDSAVDADGIPIWTYQELDSPEWKGTISLTNLPNKEKHRVLWLRVPLPDKQLESATLFFQRVFLNFEVYLNC